MATWTCVRCDAHGTDPDPALIDKAAERHTRTTGHGTGTTSADREAS